jgi:hypothetical protein
VGLAAIRVADNGLADQVCGSDPLGKELNPEICLTFFHIHRKKIKMGK